FFITPLSPPLRCTLFPYTTLFRSGCRISVFGDLSVFLAIGDVGAETAVNNRDTAIELVDVFVLVGLDLGFDELKGTFDGDTQWVDRKSTRLNSSHLVISYAVFCLK